MAAKGPEASSTLGNVELQQIDRLTEVFNGLDLGVDNPAQPGNCTQEETKLGGPQARSQLLDNKENGGKAEITPSRLACFKQLREELTCAVCLDICVRPCTTPCGHNYCRSCFRRSLEVSRPKCPKCRAELPTGFTLNINTSLWITIQHLFPADASAKPLTPPPPAAQQPAQQQPTGGQRAGRQADGHGSGAAGNHATAPFRPPRFVTEVFFSGSSSSRANAAAAAASGMGTVGMAGLPARSLSGPRLQRPSSGHSNPGAAQVGAPAGRAAGQPSSVLSLAELGVRPAREGAVGAVARRERRRSRSAERWVGSEGSLLSAPADEGPGPAIATAAAPAAAGPSARARAQPSYAELPASSSRLMDLLSGPAPRSAAAAGIHGWRPQALPRAPPAQRPDSERSAADGAAAGSTVSGTRGAPQAAAVSGPSLDNPFLRLRRPAVAAQPAAAAASAAVAPSTMVAPARDPEVARGAGLSQAAAGTQQGLAMAAAASGGGPHFTASQRALLSARLHALPADSSDGRTASSRLTVSSGSPAPRRDEAAGPEALAAAAPAAPVPRTASVTSQGSGSCSSDAFPRSSHLGSTTTLGSSLGSNWGARALDDASELELVEQDSGRRKPRGASGGGSAAVAHSALAATVNLGAGRVLSAATGAAAHQAADAEPARQLRRPLLVDGEDDCSDDGIELLLDEPTPPRGIAIPGTGVAAVRAAIAAADGPSSPSWSQLDDQLARAMEPLHISPPSLPRLRLTPRHAGSPSATAAAGSSSQPSGPGADGPTAAAGERSRPDGWPRHAMDPDLATNYDGEDPAGADTFFSSPFFDRNMLWESLQKARADPDAASEDGFSPRWAASAAAAASADDDGGGDWTREDDDDDDGLPVAQPALDAGCRGNAAAARGTESAEGLRRSARLAGARLLRAAQPQAAGAAGSGSGATTAREDRGPQAGDRRCPIELLSDSDDGEEQGAGVVGLVAPRGSAVMQGAAADEPAHSSQCVVSGLRRPRRT